MEMETPSDLTAEKQGVLENYRVEALANPCSVRLVSAVRILVVSG
jgi:hypothetical protein